MSSTSGQITLGITGYLPSSGISTLYTSTPDFESNVSLMLLPTLGKTSGVPLSILPPIQITSGIPLSIQPPIVNSSGVSLSILPPVNNNSGIPLSILTIDNESNMTLHIRHPQSGMINFYLMTPEAAGMSLNMNTDYVNNFTTYILGVAVQDNDTPLPLFIGKNIDHNDDISLFVSNDIYSASGIQQDDLADLAINGTDYNFISSGDTLFIKVSNDPNIVSGTNTIPLLMSVKEPSIGDGGGIFDFYITDLFMEGSNDSGIYSNKKTNTSLYLRAYDSSSGVLPLFIDRPTSTVIPLNIYSFINSGDMNVYISGNYIHNNNMNLSIKPLDSDNFKLFVRGYLE